MIKRLLIICCIIGINMADLAAKESPHIKVKGVKFVKSFAGIDEYQLENGLKILLKRNCDVPLFSWQVWYKVGSRNEAMNLTGLAHYLEHIMFKGTETFRKGEIAQIIQLKGGVFNAFTGDDYTAYFENFSPENLELAIKIEADRMQNSRLNAEEIDLERSVIVSELEGNKNNPHSVLYETLKANAFKVHPYRNPIIGWRDDLDNINAKNMREFYETYYYPDNAVAILAGNFDPDLALELIKKYFGQYKAKEHKRAKVPQEPKQDVLKKVIMRNGGFNKILAMAFHIPEFNHEDSAAINLAGEIVFSGMVARLYPKLVDSGLATSVSGVAESSIDPSIFRILITLNPEADIEKVEKIVDAELEDIKKNVSEDELNLAKAKEEAAFVYQRDGVYDEALQIGYFEAISNDWTKYGTWVEDINKVSTDDIKNVAKKYFKETNKTVVYLLPEEPKEALIDTANLDKKVEANYGAATVEPLDPKKLERLLKISEPKYSKNIKHSKLDLDFKVLDSDRDGLQVYLREDHSLPLVFFNAYLYAGSVNDLEKLGLAYITAEMLGRGSKAKDKYEIARLLDLYGADISVNTGKETTKLHFSTITKNLDAVVKIFKELLDEPSFEEDELERLKVQAIAKIKQEDDYPTKITDRELGRIVYPKGHPYYRHSVEERIKAIEAIKMDDIKAFYKEHYNPKNLLISVVGDINETKVREVMTTLFDKWHYKTDTELAKLSTNNRPEIDLVDIKEPQEKVVIKDDKKQVEISLGHSSHVSRLDKDYYALLIANFALGGSALSSRLGTAVRDESGFVYNIRSGFAATLGAGMFKVILGCNPKNVRNAIDLTKKVIKDFLKEGISETELEVTKSYLIGSFAARALSSNEDMVDTLSQLQVFELGDDYIKTYENRIKSISLEEVNKVARKYIHPDKLNTVIVGPKFE